MSERVAVTGMGLVCPIGLDEATFRERLFAGRHGIRRLQALDPTEYKSGNAAEVDSAALGAALAARGWHATDRTVDMALVAAAAALEQAGLLEGGPAAAPRDVATIFGTGSGPSASTTEAWENYAANGLRSIRPTTVPRCMLNAVSAQVSMKLRLTGANYAVVAACASSTVALGIGFRMIRDGHAARVLCGGAECMLFRGLYTSWDRLGVMSRGADPNTCFRPFDEGRDGFAMGEGAGALLLEPLAEARRRGARVRAEIRGYGESSDAEHITRPSAEGQAKAIRAALASAGMTPADVDVISAHGTATKSNDECESESIRAVFGPRTDCTPVLAPKPFFGHLIGAAGAVETIAAILCLEAGRLHPNLNIDRPDPGCRLCFAGPGAQATAARVAMKNSFGFGGNNSVLILSRFEENP